MKPAQPARYPERAERKRRAQRVTPSGLPGGEAVAEETEGTVTIEADPAEVMGVIADFEAYPEWADVQQAEIRGRDRRGRGIEVAYHVSMMGITASYTLSYRYRPGSTGVSWTTTQAEGAVKDIRGEYMLEDADGKTQVTYRLAVDLAIPVPGFMRRKGTRRLVETALLGLKRRVEEG
jgi:ribosome-associated toxin RatA of RatAB toxin-antitoxin module